MSSLDFAFSTPEYTPSLDFIIGALESAPVTPRYIPNLDVEFSTAVYTPSLAFQFGVNTPAPFERLYNPSLSFSFPLSTGGTQPPQGRTTGQIWPVFA